MTEQLGANAPAEEPHGRVLIVDDEPEVLTALERQLRRLFHVLTAGSGPAALEILHREQVDVIVCDQRMPEMTGADLLCAARALNPDCVRLLLTGYSDQGALVDAVNRAEIQGYLTKPWDVDAIRTTIRDAVRNARLRSENRRLLAELESSNQRLEEAVRDRTEALRNTLEAGAMGTWQWEIPEDRVCADARVARLFAMAPERVEEGPPLAAYVARIHAADRGRVSRAIRRAVEAGDAYSEEFRVLGGESERWVLARGQVQYDAEGRPYRLSGLVSDITERKRAEAELHEQLDELQRWQDVILDREGRIDELKREVNALLEEKGTGPRYPSALRQAEDME